MKKIRPFRDLSDFNPERKLDYQALFKKKYKWDDD